MGRDDDWADLHGEAPRRSRRAWEAEEAFEKLLKEHEEDCSVWRFRNLEDCDCVFSRYEDWPEQNPPRRSKTARPEMGEDGRSAKLLAGLKGVPRK